MEIHFRADILKAPSIPGEAIFLLNKQTIIDNAHTKAYI